MKSNASITHVLNLLLTLAALSAAASPALAEPDLQSSSDLSKVVPVSSLDGREVVDSDDKSLGSVQDVLIDPYAARAIALLVKPLERVDRDGPLIVPMALALPLKEDQEISLSITQSEVELKSPARIDAAGSSQFTRRWSGSVLKQFNVVPYSAVVDIDATDLDDTFVTVSQLRQSDVHQPSSDDLGRIVDVALDPKTGKARYALFVPKIKTPDQVEPSDAHFAVPFAAFVVKSATEPWMIELPKKLVVNSKQVKPGALPRRVDRGWNEYVHVRYGSSPSSGVQRQFHEDKPPREQAKPETGRNSAD